MRQREGMNVAAVSLAAATEVSFNAGARTLSSELNLNETVSSGSSSKKTPTTTTYRFPVIHRFSFPHCATPQTLAGHFFLQRLLRPKPVAAIISARHAPVH